jgi:hypothetical protein
VKRKIFFTIFLSSSDMSSRLFVFIYTGTVGYKSILRKYEFNYLLSTDRARADRTTRHCRVVGIEERSNSR